MPRLKAMNTPSVCQTVPVPHSEALTVPPGGTILPSDYMRDTIPDENPFRAEDEANRREIRQIVAELDEWCAKARRVDIPLPLYSDEELSAQCVPLDRWRWDLSEKGLRGEDVGVFRSDYLTPLECEAPL
jgi:hypothetical protein